MTEPYEQFTTVPHPRVVEGADGEPIYNAAWAIWWLGILKATAAENGHDMIQLSHGTVDRLVGLLAAAPHPPPGGEEWRAERDRLRGALEDLPQTFHGQARASQNDAGTAANGSYQKGLSNGEVHAYTHAAKIVEHTLASYARQALSGGTDDNAG